MGRVIIGAAAAAIAMFVIGFIFFATPLAGIGMSELDNARAAAVQQSLAQNIPATGTYSVPGGGTPEQTVMYGQGPIATIHYNSAGYPVADAGALVSGLVLDFVVALIIGTALAGVAGRVPDFGSRARLVVLFSIAAAAYMHLGEPIYYHHDWANAIYLFVGDSVALIAAGLIIARWFLGGIRTAAPAATGQRFTD